MNTLDKIVGTMLILIVIFCAGKADASDVDILLQLGSKHIGIVDQGDADHTPFNEGLFANYGLGIRYKNRYTIGAYKNSFGNSSFAASIEAEAYRYDRFRFGARLGVASYPKEIYPVVPVISAFVEKKNLRLDLILNYQSRFRYNKYVVYGTRSDGRSYTVSSYTTTDKVGDAFGAVLAWTLIF